MKNITRTSARILAGSILALITAQSSAESATLVWDGNDATAGFDTASGTWAAPTAGTATAGWSTDLTGLTTVNGNSVTTSTGDSINFGSGATGLGAGTITVSGTVASGDMTFASGSGAIVLSGGTITLAAAQTMTVNNTTDTISSILAGAATSLTKSGTGALILSGANTYSGATSITGGTLKAGSTTALGATSGLSISGGATFDLGGNNLTLAALSTATGTITDSSAAGSGGILKISATLGGGNATLFTGSVGLQVQNGNGNTLLTNTANTYSGGTYIGIGDNQTRLVPSGTVGTGTPGALTSGIFGTGTIFVGSATADRGQIYLGNANTTINNAITYNSQLGTDIGSGLRVDNSGNILAGTQTAGLTAITIGGFGGGLTITGRITGSGTYSGNTALYAGAQNYGQSGYTTPVGSASGLIVGSVTGGGGISTVILNNASANNNYTGDTFITASGVLQANAANQLPSGASTGNVYLNGKLNLQGNSQAMGLLSGSGTLDGVSGTPTLTIGGNNATGLTFSGVIKNTGGSLALTKTGNGTQTLSGANTYTGATTISGGTLQIGAGGTTGSLSASSAITNNGNLTINRSNAVTQGADFSAAAITGNGSFTQAGTGTTTITVANTYTGATNINAGTLKLQPGAAIPTAPVAGYARWFDASTISGSNGASISTWNDLSGNAANATMPGGSNTAPTLVSNAGTETGLSALHFNAGGGANSSQALTFTRDTNVRTVFSIFKGSSFLITDSNNYGFHRPGDSNPADPLFATNYGGDMNNVLGGSTYINGALVNPQSFAMPTNLHNGYNLVSVLTAGAVAANGFNKDRTFHSGDQSQAEVLIYDSVLSNANRLAVEAYLNYKWFGIGSASSPGSLPSTTPLSIATGAAFDLNGVSQQVFSLTGTSGASVTNSGATDSILTVSGTTSTIFGGVISDGATNKISFVKSGAGTVTLSGANTYTGTTTVSAGTLLVSGSLSGSSAVTVQSGGTLGTSSGTGGGTVGAVSVQSGGTLAPGASTGLMTTGNLAIASGGILATEVNNTGFVPGTDYDRLIVNGTVNITGSTLTLSGSYATTPSVTNDLFFILLNDSTDTVTGNFNGVAEGGHVYSGSQDYLISYRADSSLTNSGNFGTFQGNDIALMAVPEPSAVVSLLGGLGLLLGMRRRRNA